MVASRRAMVECSLPTVPAGPVRVAVDNYYQVVAGGGVVGSFHGSPNHLEDAVAGLLLREGLLEPGGQAAVERVESLGGRRYRVYARPIRPQFAARPQRVPVPWEAVEKAFTAFISTVSKRVCPYAVHTLAAYRWQAREGEVAGVAVVSDVSRHTAALKLAGLVSRLYTSPEPPSGLIAVSTGRISGDMVYALARLGFTAIVANHHPVMSGVLAAMDTGLALVLRSPDGKGLAVYTGHELVRGGQRVAIRVPSTTPPTYRGVPLPLC